MKNIRRICCVLSAVICIASAAQTTQAAEHTKAAPSFVMPNTHMHTISTNKTINKDYLLYVHLPESYDASKTYPVLYLLDPWWDFPVVAGAHSGMVYDGVIPSMIIVGIGLADLSADPNVLRNSDYTPTKTALANTGDGKAFLNFISAKVIPFVESTYAVDKNFRVLAGTSYGGLFTLYTMFEKPGLFQGHIAISPAVVYDNNWLFQREADFKNGKQTRQLNSHLYMAVGDKDPLPDFVKEIKAFNFVLEKSAHQKLNLKFEVRKNAYHASVKLGAFSQGLMHAFSPYLKVQN